MAETPFTIGADAICTDGVCGKVIRLVVDPVARAVTHMVVEPRHRPGLGLLVPLQPCRCGDTEGSPAALHPGGVRSARRRRGNEFRATDQPGPVPRLQRGTGIHLALLRPDRTRGRAGDPRIRADRHRLPASDKVGIRRNERVFATDGEIGRVEGLVIDPLNHHVSHVLLQEGHLFDRREVAVPIGAVIVTRVEDSVQLNITKQQVENLPPVNTDHFSG